jgi:hypothetical protein
LEAHSEALENHTERPLNSLIPIFRLYRLTSDWENYEITILIARPPSTETVGKLVGNELADDFVGDFRIQLVPET